MEDKKLKIIDFSKGIKQKEIQHNFNVIQSEINKERKTVGGTGISYGFDFILDGFNLKITEGMLIANDGSEVYIDETNLEIEKPILIERKELLLNVDEYNRIQLSENPYAATRTTTADNVSIDDSGIKAVLSSDNDIELSIANVNKNYITLNEFNGIDSEKIDVFYNVSYKRRDVVFIDKNYKLQYRTGITSTSPSVPDVGKDEYSYMLGYIEIDAHEIKTDNKEYASAKFIKDFRSVRNIYNDSLNNLYLCGIPFNAFKTIYVTEPRNPQEYTFWFDSFSNELKVWRHTDISTFADTKVYTSSNPNNPQLFGTNVKYKYNQNQLTVYINNEEIEKNIDFEEGSDLTELQKEDPSNWSKQFHIIRKLKKGDVVSYRIKRFDGYAEWVPANDKSFIPIQERFIWTPDYQSHLSSCCEFDKQHFFFDCNSNRNLLFVPETNALEIMIDQVPLHSDQFEEITINDAIASNDAGFIRRQLTEFYNYKNDFDAYKAAEKYENIGIGFKLAQPLDKNTSYIEVRVTHRVNSNPIAQRFQRSATFIADETINYDKYIKTDDNKVVVADQIFTCKYPYRYKENQLEVYVDGIKLTRGIDFEEVAENDSEKGCTLFNFRILTELKDKAKVNYKITSSVFSYDNVETLLSGFQIQLDTIKAESDKSIKLINDMKKDVDNYTSEIKDQLESLNNIESALDSKYLPNNAKIGKDNFDENLFKGIAKNNINVTFNITGNKQKFDVTNICSEKDFILLIDINTNKILIRDTDFTLDKENNYVFLHILTEDINIGHTIYLTGIRFNR